MTLPTDRPHRPSISAWLAERVLGTDPSNRRLLRRTLLSGAVYAAALVGEALGLFFGLSNPVAVACLSVYMLVGTGSFYLAMRSGWNQRLEDRSMTGAQILFATSALLFAYPVNGPFRGLSLLAVSVPPLFGFFSLSRRAGVAIVASVPLMFGPMMLALALLDPARFDPRVEALHFAILASCMTALGVLLWQICSKRDRVRTQKLELSVALERIEAISTRDELTGLFNRHYMTTRLEDEVGRRGRGTAPFCIGLIDIDYFKRINDAHGHARGDAVLRRFALVLQAGLRDADVLARWGGEEFLLLLPGTTAAAGLDRVEALRHYGAELAEWGEEAPLRVRFSAGVAEDRGEPVATLLERADRALYQAKATGRDRVVRAAEPQPAAPISFCRSPAAAA